MTVFGPGWEGHPQAFFDGWRRLVNDDDLVLIPGDISWAMRLEEALIDLQAIAALPGEKVLLRGNHDYWWPSLRKLRAALPPRMHALQNNALRFGEVVVGGTRGWICPGSPGFTDDDERIYQREVQRLALSLRAMAALPGLMKVVLLHYPPSNARAEESGFMELLRAAAPDVLAFGHIHGGAPVVLPTLVGTAVHFVAADRLAFEPRLLCG